ncbi:unnamed protein product [Prunus armeniaca]
MSFGMRNLRYIEEIKEALERECPGAVSCSDILVLSAREGVVRDVVVISKADKVGEPTVITANCPNKTGWAVICAELYCSLGEAFAEEGLETLKHLISSRK